jgi:hypothetical protein
MILTTSIDHCGIAEKRRKKAKKELCSREGAKTQRKKGRVKQFFVLGSSLGELLAIFGWRLIRRDLLEVNGAETI